jgi:tripartite-type tricarboxylate transporter receptor subunit TctC
MVHVPYKSGAQSIPDLIGGRVQLSFTTLSTLTPLVDKGKIRVLAITQGPRSERWPDLPLLTDILPGYEVPPGWIGILGPPRLPSAINQRLSEALIKGANAPDVKARIAQVGTTIHTRTSDEFAASMKKDYEIAAKLIRGAGVAAD